MSDRPDPAWLALLAPLGGGVAIAVGTRLGRRAGAPAQVSPVQPLRVAGLLAGAVVAAGAFAASAAPPGGVAALASVLAGGAILGVLAPLLARRGPPPGVAEGAPFERAVDEGAAAGLGTIGAAAAGAGLSAAAGLALGPDAAGPALGVASFALGAVLQRGLGGEPDGDGERTGWTRSGLASLAVAIAAAVALGVDAALAPGRLTSGAGDPAARVVTLALAVAGLGALGTAAARAAVRSEVHDAPEPGAGLSRALLRGPLITAAAVALGARLVEEAADLTVGPLFPGIVPTLSLPLAAGLGLGLLALAGADWPVGPTERGASLARAGAAFRAPWVFAALALLFAGGSFAAAGPLGAAACALCLATLVGIGATLGGAGAALERLPQGAAPRAIAGPARVADARLAVTAALLSAAAASLAASPALVLDLVLGRPPAPLAVRGLQVGLALGALIVASTRVAAPWVRLAPLALAAVAGGAALALGGTAALGAAPLPALVVVVLGLGAGRCGRSRPEQVGALQALALVAVLAAAPARAPRAGVEDVAPARSSAPVLRAADGPDGGG